ncbi:hypothetical protein QR680_007931 [Steinernema hermaphroditum]|uniref:Uncharacterized protein n=1 Tax=Steinernema hermaphroditum TaxID=289476 RepID=A0AA39IEP3_9BILA|nr:hypothetical protein QR680_007931 [Steinernema hermaphroditum]
MNEIFLLEGAVKDTSGSTPSRPNRFSKPGYSIKLCHRSGASNKMCDYRSRFPASSSSEEDLVATLVAELETDTEDQDLAPSENPEEEIDHRPVSQEEIREEQRKVPEYKKIIDALDSNIPEAITQYELGDDTLRLKAERCTKENPSIGGQIARGRGTSEESGGSEYPPPEAPNPEDDRGAPQEPIVAQM